MSVIAAEDLDRIDVGDLELWNDGPPHDLFTRLRREAPRALLRARRVPLRGRLLVADPRRRRAPRQPRLGDVLLLRRRLPGPRRHRDPARGDAAADDLDGPAAPRPPQGAVPARLHAAADRRARGADPRHRQHGPRQGRRRRRRRSGQRRRRAGRLAGDRVVHRLARGGRRAAHERDEHGARVRRRGAAPDRGGGRGGDAQLVGRDDGDGRRAPREPGDGRPDGRARPLRGRRREALRRRDLHGPRPARRGGERLDPVGVHERDAGAARGSPSARAAGREAGDDRVRGRGAAADVPGLRPLPAHGDARRRDARQDDPRRRQGAALVRLLESRRGGLRGRRSASTSPAIPTTRRSAPAAGTSASAPRSRGSRSRSCSRRRCAASPRSSSPASRPRPARCSSTS